MAAAYRQKIDWLKQEILALSDKLNNGDGITPPAGGTAAARERIITVLKRYRFSSDGTQTLTSTLNLMELWASLLGELMQRTAARLMAPPVIESRPPLPPSLLEAVSSTSGATLLPTLVVPGSAAAVDDGKSTPRDRNNTAPAEYRHPLASVQACLPAVLGIIQAYDTSNRTKRDRNESKSTDGSQSARRYEEETKEPAPRALPPAKKLRPLQPSPPSTAPPTDRSVATATNAAATAAAAEELETLRKENAELRDRLNLVQATLKGAPKSSTAVSTTPRPPRRSNKAAPIMADAACQTDREVCEECPKRRTELTQANRSITDLKTEVKRLNDSTNQLTEQIALMEEKYDSQADATQNFRVENQALKVRMGELEKDKQKFDKLKVTSEEFRTRNASLAHELEKATKIIQSQKDNINQLERTVLTHEATIETKSSEAVQLRSTINKLTDENQSLADEKSSMSRGHEQALTDNRKRNREIREAKEALEARIASLEAQLFKAQIDATANSSDLQSLLSTTKASHLREVDELKRQLTKNQNESQRALQADLTQATANVNRLTKELLTATDQATKYGRENKLLSTQLESETKRAHEMASMLSGLQQSTKDAKDQVLLLQISNDSLRTRAEMLEKNFQEEQASASAQLKAKALVIQKLEEDLHAARKQITQLSAPANVQRPMQLKRMDSHSQLLREAKTPGRSASTDWHSDVVDRISSEMSANLLQKHLDDGRVQLKTLVETANTPVAKEHTGTDRSDYGSVPHRRTPSRITGQ